MRAAIVAFVLVVAVSAVAEGHTRKALATGPRTATTTPTAPTTGSLTAPQTIKTIKGMVKVGVVATGPARMKTPKAPLPAAAKVEQSNSESCRSVGPREYCDSDEQANCCEYLGSSNHWMGCDISSNLYMCDKEKPVSVCCS